MLIFSSHSKEEHADSLADYCPNDDMWAAKKIDGKKLRQLLLGFARQLRQGEDFLETVWEEADPSTTTAFIADWEAAVGIPDSCFPGTGTIEDRRAHVLVKLTAAVQTADDFKALATLLGLDVEVKSGIEAGVFPYVFPLIFFGSPKESRFTMLVTVSNLLGKGFPYTFPLVFSDPVLDILKCLFNKLKPANTQVVFIQD